ncbi:MAG: PhzF family phenazine biosynthesis protein [Ignavibacteriales bacterium]|nr:PhzF family phenazine biosynthesis protein [Ignavibacteriales bacterium]
MKTYHLKHMNAFTNEPFSGNPAGVVLDAKGLSEKTMQAIARDMSLPETAFVLPPTTKSADIQIRWFTPTVEVPLCGHATIATFQALAEEGLHGMKHAGKYKFRLQTKSGVLNITVEKSYSGVVVEFQLPVPRFHVKKIPSSLLKALGIRSSDVESRLPFVSHSYLYLPVKKFSTLKSLQPDFTKLKAVNESTRTLAVCVLSLETIEQSSAVHSRFFGPAVGINEDPVTGSANGPLGVYLYHYAIPAEYPIPSLLLPDGRIEFLGEQGDVIGRRGRVKIRLRVSGRAVKDVAIAGEAVTLMDSTLKC